MTHTETLIARIKAVAEKQQLSPVTVAAKLLGSGVALANLEAGKTITLAKYERACAMLDEIEAGEPA